MEKTTADQSAFPVVADFGPGDRQCSEGLTKREYFAAMAMQGMLCNDMISPMGSMGTVAEQSVMAADALIEQLNKPTEA